MQCGISTACFYPRDTLESFTWIAEHGVLVTELFINTFCELEDDYVEKLLHVQRETGIRVSSVHPFTGMIEGFFFASGYSTRIRDGVALYRRFYEICRLLGADKLVFHGDHEFNLKKFSNEDYAANFRQLAKVGKEYGVTLCQENVAYCRCSDTRAVHALRPLFGECSAFVLDLKQAVRRGTGLYAMVDEMAGDIRQVHISDHDATEHCLLPGAGDFDFVPFLARLQELGYNDDLIIELYSDNYERPEQLLESMHLINRLLQQA